MARFGMGEVGASRNENILQIGIARSDLSAGWGYTIDND
jgi:hypothetical protein